MSMRIGCFFSTDVWTRLVGSAALLIERSVRQVERRTTGLEALLLNVTVWGPPRSDELRYIRIFSMLGFLLKEIAV